MEAVNPLKLYEYMTYGVPIISTPMDLSFVSSPHVIASGADEWGVALNACIENCQKAEFPMLPEFDWKEITKKHAFIVKEVFDEAEH